MMKVGELEVFPLAIVHTHVLCLLVDVVLLPQVYSQRRLSDGW